MAAGSTAALKKLGRSPSVTLHQGKQRGVKQFYASAADGYLLVAVVIVKDNHIKTLSFHFLSQYLGGYELWVILVPNKKTDGGSVSSVLGSAPSEVLMSSSGDVLDSSRSSGCGRKFG